jgi:hypothetical protein
MNSFVRVDCWSEADGEDDVSTASKRRTAKSTFNSFDWKNKLQEEMMDFELVGPS